ncbi:trigger factor [Candidatus Uhrbacteria bacterium]|nr:trigger factor [Candidatus Uhrbacteria bacterium]
MADIRIEQLPKSKVRVTVTVPQSELAPYLEEAASRISQSTSIPGFRPGKATVEAVKNRVGETSLYQQVLDIVVRKTLLQSLMEHQLDTIGSPHINVISAGPGKDVSFEAEFARLPQILSAPALDKTLADAKKVELEANAVEKALQSLQKMQTKEVRESKETGVTGTHKVVMSMDIKKDGVGIEGGQSPNHAIYLAEEYYIPGLKEQLLGLKEGETKEFRLPFPEEHAQKHIAGKEVSFSVGIKEIYRLEPPALDDEFAKSIGKTSMVEVRDLIQKNLQLEKEQEESNRQEREMLEKLNELTKFEEVPDILINEEINKMTGELERNVASHGLALDEYLKSIKKSLSELKIEFAKPALVRIKIALLLKHFAKEWKIEADAMVVDQELDSVAAQMKTKEDRAQVFSPEYRAYMEGIQRNRMVLERLRSSLIKSAV